MSWIGEAVGAITLLSKIAGWFRGRRDPTRCVAQRLIEAFEAYGIQRQQIIRLVPEPILSTRPQLSMADFSTPSLLGQKLSPALLDWAAGYLNLQRAWMDNQEVSPHPMVDFYKQPSKYENWFELRRRACPDSARLLLVWKTEDGPLGPESHGPLCAIYEEIHPGLDGNELSHYWLITDGWSSHHPPCVSNLAALIAVASASGIPSLGRTVPSRILEKLVAGNALISSVKQSARSAWYPRDLIDPPSQEDSPWRKVIWNDAQLWLGATIE